MRHSCWNKIIPHAAIVAIVKGKNMFGYYQASSRLPGMTYCKASQAVTTEFQARMVSLSPALGGSAIATYRHIGPFNHPTHYGNHLDLYITRYLGRRN